MALNAKQRLFIKEYLKDKNGTRAAIAVGYSEKAARAIASENLTKPDIKKEIEKGLAKLADKADVSAQRTIDRIASIAYHDKYAKNTDVLKACELLGKHFKLFTDVQEITGKDGGPQVILTMPANGSEAVSEKGEGIDDKTS